MAHKEVEDKLLGVYKKVSPSIHRLDSPANVSRFYETRRNILNTLTLPPQIFKGRKVIDIGGGTGEKSLLYALWGSDVTIVEPNEKSCAYAQNIFSKLSLGKHLKTINKSLYEFDLSILQQYDIVICEAVLHHTYDPIRGLDLILKNLTGRQIVLIAMGETHGVFKRHLQIKLVNKLAGSNEEKIIEISKKYFREHIDRAVKYGVRREDAVIYDTFVNTIDRSSSLEDICTTFEKNGVSYLSAYPRLELFYLTIPWSQKREDPFNYKFYKNYYQFLEKVWMTCGEENLVRDLENFDFTKIQERVECDVMILKGLEKKIEEGNFENKELDVIRNGYMGVGANFFVGLKDDNEGLNRLEQLGH